MNFAVPEREVDRGVFERFQASIDPEWVAEALVTTGTATLRRRRLPAEQVIWLVLGMALFRDLSIIDVVKHLALVLPKSGSGRLADSAVMQARARLGASPLRWLFEKSAGVWAKASADRLRWMALFRDLSIVGVVKHLAWFCQSPDREGSRIARSCRRGRVSGRLPSAGSSRRAPASGPRRAPTGCAGWPSFATSPSS